MNEHDRFRFFVRTGSRPAARHTDATSATAPAPAPPMRTAARATSLGTAARATSLGTAAPATCLRASAESSGTTLSAATWPPPEPAQQPRQRPRRCHLRLVTRLERSRDDDGFSLLELLVVVAILGILVAAALPRFAEFRAAAYDSRSQQDLRNLAAAEELFRATSPTYADDAALLSGFQASEGVEIALESADETGFVATATHPAGARDFRWDSSADPPLSSVAR
jgi:type IV pilus assembly protein PilA